MSKRARGWTAALADVLRAVRADPGLLTPALIVAGLALSVAYLAWRFL